MVKLSIRHTTIYRYDSPVALGEHRIMLRPRESRELNLLAMELVVEPHAVVNWAHDVVGNAVATASFGSVTDHAVIRGIVELEFDTPAWPIFNIAASASSYPFRYSGDEALDLGARVVSGYLHDPAGHAMGSSGAGSTHAWAEVYVTGASWIAFDPTNRNAGART